MKFLSIILSVLLIMGVFPLIQTPAKVTNNERTFAADNQIMPLSTSISITYLNKDDSDQFKMVLRAPQYTECSYKSACACIAGGNVLGFYDRYDENLIPNHKSGTAIANTYVYAIEDQYVINVINQLYSDMGTSDIGTTVANFKKGMETYCERLGKRISFSSCMTKNNFNYEASKTFMKNNQPVVIFLDKYNFASISSNSNYDIITYSTSSINHTVVSFGYLNIQYTLSSGTKNYQFLNVAGCIDEFPTSYLDINNNAIINDALVINIY